MSKKNETEDEVIVDLGGSYNNVERYIEENQRTLTLIVAVIALSVGAFFAYNKYHLEPLQEEASQQMWRAEKYFEVDSLDKALYGDMNFPGFEEIADEYSGTEAANLSNYYIGLIYMKKGDYELAIDYLKDFSSDDVMLSSVALGAIGDAYAQLGNLEEAAAHYKMAANNNANEFTTPLYLMRAGKTYDAIGMYSKSLPLYKTIKKEYPETTEGREVEKYLVRAEEKSKG